MNIKFCDIKLFHINLLWLIRKIIYTTNAIGDKQSIYYILQTNFIYQFFKRFFENFVSNN